MEKKFPKIQTEYVIHWFLPDSPVRVLFSPMVSGWAGGRREKVCPGCISETVSCRKLILGRDIG